MLNKWLNNKRKNLGLVAVVLALVLALVGGSCGPAPGGEERVVKVGINALLTGALASNGISQTYGMIDCMEYINNMGGLNGIKNTVLWEDTKGIAPGAITSHRRFKEAGIVLEFQTLSSQIETLAPSFVQDEIPVIWGGGATESMMTKPERWVYLGSPSWGSELATMIKWARANWREKRNPRLGVIIWDHPSGYGVLEGVEAASALDVDYIGREVIPMLGVIDTSVEWLRLAAKKPDWIFIYSAGATVVVQIKDAKRLDMAGRGIILGEITSLDELILSVVGRDADGWFVTMPTAICSDIDLPGIKPVLEAAQKRGWREDQVPAIYIRMWTSALVGTEAIRLALEKVGVENLTGRAVRDAFTSIQDFDVGGLLPPVTVTDYPPCYNKHMLICQVQGGKLVRASDWIETPWVPDWALSR